MSRSALVTAVRRLPSGPLTVMLLSTLGRVRQGLPRSPLGSEVADLLIKHAPSSATPDSLYAELAEVVPLAELLTSDDRVCGEIVRILQPSEVLLRDVGLYSAGPGPATEWDIKPGDVIPRQLVHKRFGGQQQGGISTPAHGKRVMLFTNSEGAQYGTATVGCRMAPTTTPDKASSTTNG